MIYLQLDWFAMVYKQTTNKLTYGGSSLQYRLHIQNNGDMFYADHLGLEDLDNLTLDSAHHAMFYLKTRLIKLNHCIRPCYPRQALSKFLRCWANSKV